MTKHVIFIGFTLVGLATVFGQSQQVKTPEAHAELPDARAQSPRFEKIATGFDLYAILQDRDGFWWLATQSGLVKYNGYDFHRYSAGEHSITGNFVNALYEDSEGILWIGTTSGLCSYDKATDRFTQYKHDPRQPESISHDNILMFQTIVEDRDGAIWVGTGDGLNRYDKSEKRFTRYSSDPTDPAKLIDNFIGAIIRDRHGFLWVGTIHGLHKFDPTKGIVVERYPSQRDDPMSLHGGNVTALMEDSDGKIWVGTHEDGLKRLDPVTRTVTHYVADSERASSLSSNFVFSMIEFPDGKLWITTFGGGLNIFDPYNETFSPYQYNSEANDPDGISSNLLMDIVMDNSGAVWIATLDGEINRYDPAGQRFQTVRHVPGVHNSVSKGSYIGQIIEDHTGVVWIAVGGAGLDRYDRKTGAFTHYRHVPDDPESLPESYGHALIEDTQGNLWMTSMSWIVLVDRETGKAKKSYPAKAWPHSPIEDRGDPDILWFGTGGSGLLKFHKPTGETTYFEPDPSSETSVSVGVALSIYQDDEGFIWITSLGGGLDRFDPRTGKVVAKYKHNPDDPTTLASNTLYQFFRDSSGTYWIGSEAGLNRFDPNTGTFRRFSERDGTFPMGSAGQIAEYPRGQLWIGGDGGIVRFDPETGDARLYRVDFHIGAFRPLVTEDGELWFYEDNTIIRFHPEAITDETTSTSIPVYITSLTQRGKPLNLGAAPEKIRSIHLDWRNNFFEFEFAGLDYRSVGDIQYRYRLEGVDEDWYDAGTTRRGRYTGLEGGTYALQVMATNKDGQWSDHIAELSVVVDRPPWRTWWFRIVAGASVLALAFGGYRRRIRNIETQKKQLEIQVAEQTKEIRDTQVQLVQSEKMAALGKLTAGIVHEINTPVGALKSTMDTMSRCGRKINQILENSNTLAELKDNSAYQKSLQILEENRQVASSAGDRIMKVVTSLRNFTRLDEAEFEKADIHEGLDSALTLIQHEMEDRVRVEKNYVDIPEIRCYPAELNQVFMTLLRNAAQAIKKKGTITIKTSSDENSVYVRISDTGKGMPPGKIKTLFELGFTTKDTRVGMAMGLINAYNIIQNHEGELKVESEVGKGSTFTIILPMDLNSRAIS